MEVVKKIYIDGLGLVENHFSGIGQYILGILQGIDQLIEDAKYAGKPHPEVIVFIPFGTRTKFLSFGLRYIRYKRLPLNFRWAAALWHRGWMPPVDLWCGRGTYIFPRFVGMPLLFSKSALVIYDLSYELHREFSDEGNALFLSKFVRKSVKKAQKVIAISDNARREIMDFYKLPSDKVVVATPATNPALFYRRSQQEITRVKQRYGIDGDYILALSNLEPRKNLRALVNAYCQLPKEITDKVSLLLVGVSGWKTDALFNEIIKKVDEGYNIIRPSEYVLDKDKPAIISGAKMLVYPSHYEGFGMPPIEALACGVPVIAANNSSLPQAVGNAGQLVNIDDDGKLLLTAVKDTLDNIGKYAQRATIEGPAQARTFSWEASAQIFLDVVKEIK